MIKREAGAIRYYQFTAFENQAVYHAVFTRRGGISAAPWKSLNFGASVGDDFTHVQWNKQTALKCLDLETTSIFDVYQVHSNNVVQTESPLMPGEAHIQADGIITHTPGVTLVMRFADCVPILIYDPIHQAIGLVHAGWKGTINKIAKEVIDLMRKCYETNPQDVIAAIGPSIGPDHYTVGPDVIQHVNKVFGGTSDEILIEDRGKQYFDLWKTNKIILNEQGVNSVEIANMCTNCHIEDWYSHRGEHGRTGRFGVAFGLLE